MIPTDIPLTLRVPPTGVGRPLTAQEMDANLTALRTAVLGLASTVQASRVVIGPEPAPGERVGVLWIPADGSGAFIWNASLSRWVVVQEKLAWEDASTGTGAAYEITMPFATPDLASLTGRFVMFVAHLANTGAATLKINSLSPIPMVQPTGAALLANQIPIGHAVVAVIDGTNARVINPAPLYPELAVKVAALYAKKSSNVQPQAYDESNGGKTTIQLSSRVDPHSIVTPAGDDFTIQPGSYRIDLVATFRTDVGGAATIRGSLQILDITESVDTPTIIANKTIFQVCGDSSSDEFEVFLTGVLVAATQKKIRFRFVSAGSAAGFLGSEPANQPSYDEVYSQAVITKYA